MEVSNIVDFKNHLTKVMLSKGLIMEFDILLDTGMSAYYKVEDDLILISVGKKRVFDKKITEKIIADLFISKPEIKVKSEKKLGTTDLKRIYDTLNGLFFYLYPQSDEKTLYFDIDVASSSSIKTYKIDFDGIRPTILINKSNREILSYKVLEEIATHIVDYKERGFTDNSEIFRKLKKALFTDKNYKKGMFNGKSINIEKSSIKQLAEFITNLKLGTTLIFDDSDKKKIVITKENAAIIPKFISKSIVEGKIKESIYIAE